MSFLVKSCVGSRDLERGKMSHDFDPEKLARKRSDTIFYSVIFLCISLFLYDCKKEDEFNEMMYQIMDEVDHPH
jgi:hypothetical protein